MPRRAAAAARTNAAARAALGTPQAGVQHIPCQMPTFRQLRAQGSLYNRCPLLARWLLYVAWGREASRPQAGHSSAISRATAMLRHYSTIYRGAWPPSMANWCARAYLACSGRHHPASRSCWCCSSAPARAVLRACSMPSPLTESGSSTPPAGHNSKGGSAIGSCGSRFAGMQTALPKRPRRSTQAAAPHLRPTRSRQRWRIAGACRPNRTWQRACAPV